MNQQDKLILFQNWEIRRIWHQKEWWFSVSDVVGALSESKNSKAYWRKLKQREPQLVTICHGLKLTAQDGKMRQEDCSNREGLLRIIQSVPSKKAEPFKQWLAQVGSQRLDEIENPDLIAERFRSHYQNLGYPEQWIKNRWQSVLTRAKLTDEWKNRGVKEGLEYAILTAIISEETFGLKPSDHKNFKKIKRENLRDHMTDLELIFTMLGEEQTRQETIRNDHQGFDENKISAQRGGAAAGKALEAFEEQTGQKVLSDKNYKDQIKDVKKQQRLLARKKKKKN
ncbi:MAG: Bro-N domain-containing protein [Bacteroidota bacterium]